MKDNPAQYEPIMAKIEDKYAALYWNQGEIVKAALHFTNALYIYRKYREKDPETYDLFNALTCMNLARMHIYVYENKGHHPENKEYALRFIEEALDRLKTYPANNPEIKNWIDLCTNLKKDLTNK